tara:strand:+ start:377 stop:589 length:213 start_codon:yes stop_codon:yes gene_type:complete
MDNIKKFITATRILKSDVEMVFNSEINTEEDFNKVQWVTGTDDKGTAILTTTCPHSELTWTKVKEEMDKL